MKSRWPWIVGAVATLLLYLPLHLGALLTTAVACSGDGGEPYAAPASPRGRYCAAFDAGGGIALLLLPPVIVIGLLYAALTLRRPRAFVAALVAAFTMTLVLFALVAGLPGECAGDDESKPGCSHY